MGEFKPPERYKMRVLLAEDEPDIRLITRLSLEDAGYDVTLVGDGQAAVAAAQHSAFDVVLLDVMMPLMDGFAACRQLKADAHTRSLPVIFLTAKSQEAEVHQGLALGAIGYIIKPFDVFELAHQIESLLARSDPRA
ncbi:MAG: response regulator [Chloroflexales bacterium]|nr:response regulator [Chloroflexales bacterium]